MDKLTEAVCFAAEAFDNMERKVDKRPAVLHSLEAAVIVSALTDEKEAVIAAVLHDTVEDAGVKIGEITERFGERVAALVMSETEDKRENQKPSDSWKIRKEESVELLGKTNDLGVKALYLGDKLSNMRSLCRAHEKYGDEMWGYFNQHSPEEHKWYYTSIRDMLTEFEGRPEYAEYRLLIDKLFGEK